MRLKLRCVIFLLSCGVSATLGGCGDEFAPPGVEADDEKVAVVNDALSGGRAGIFFYDQASGSAATSIVAQDGRYAAISSMTGFTRWTHVVTLHSDALFFYDAVSGYAFAASLDESGQYRPSGVLGNLYQGYTHAVAVGYEGIFLYDADAGVGSIVRVTREGGWGGGPDLRGLPRYTHVVGTPSGKLFLYSRATGAATTAIVDSYDGIARLTFVETLQASTNWTHITDVGHQGLFFYDVNQGVGWVSRIDDDGRQRAGVRIDGFSRGIDFVVGASNGTLFFLDNDRRQGAIARISPDGGYTSVSEISGFLGWTHVSAD